MRVLSDHMFSICCHQSETSPHSCTKIYRRPVKSLLRALPCLWGPGDHHHCSALNKHAGFKVLMKHSEPTRGRMGRAQLWCLKTLNHLTCLLFCPLQLLCEREPFELHLTPPSQTFLHFKTCESDAEGFVHLAQEAFRWFHVDRPSCTRQMKPPSVQHV